MYKKIISPILDNLDSEMMHKCAVEALHIGESNPIGLRFIELASYKGKRFVDKKLEVKLEDILFENPLIVGAGWDKAGRAVKGLWQLGFSGVEVGTVTPLPQKGNPKPRQFMLGHGVALNRLGLNSPGMDVVAKNIERYRNSSIPIGISLGKNKDILDKDVPAAHAIVARKFYEYGSYFTINVSSPNTPGLRKLQEKAPLLEIVDAILKEFDNRGKRKPLFIKIAPDLEKKAIDDVIEVVLEKKLAGIVATNTTIRADLKAKYGEKWRSQEGGLSGDDADFRKMSTEIISHIYKETKGKIKIIGVGGVKDTKTALEKIKAGASLLQIVTAIRGEGTSVAGGINSGLLEWMEKEGVKNISEVVGIAV